MLAKETVVDLIEILETGHIQVRRAIYITEDGQRIAGPTYHRMTYAPGEDVRHEDRRVQAQAQAAWTTDVVTAHQARVAAQRTIRTGVA